MITSQQTRLRRFALALPTVYLCSLAAAAPGLGANPQPRWWSYQRSPQYRQVLSQVDVAMPDGAKLACGLSLPGESSTQVAPGRFPALLDQYTPYATLDSQFDATDGAYFSERGYAVLVCAVRGTGLSGGTYTCCGGTQEAHDGYDLIEWLAHQPWSDGRVGMAGDSYGGITTINVAALHPPHLIAIAPQQFADNPYLDIVYPGGIQATFTLDNWPTLVATLSSGRLSVQALQNTFLQHPTLDSLWDTAAPETKYARLHIPILDINAGRPDYYFRRSLAANHAGLKHDPDSWFIVGPWSHGAWSGPRNQQVPIGVELAWFDHWLLSRPHAWSAPAHDRLMSYEEPMGAGHGWEALDNWPPSDVIPETLYLTEHDTLATAPGRSGTRSYTGLTPANPPCPTALATCNRPAGARGGYLVFNTHPFPHDTVLAGQIQVHLNATANAANANMYAEIFDIAPNGTATFIDDGELLASHRSSNSHPTPITPHRRYCYRFDIAPFNWRFVKGHQLRLRISGGPADEFVAPEPTPTTMTVSLGGRAGSYVELPARSLPPGVPPPVTPQPAPH